MVELDLPAPEAAQSAWLWRLGPRLEKLLDRPALRRLLPLANTAIAVAEPAGRASLKTQPDWTATRSAAAPLTILSANLWHDWVRRQRFTERLAVLADLVVQEAVDIVLLQEVARTRVLHADAWLAKRLGMAAVYARANGSLTGIGAEEGLAILSRFPLRQPALRQLGVTANPFARRICLHAWADTPSGSLALFCAHLSLVPRRNALQLAELRAWVPAVAGEAPAIVGGDFNAPETAGGIRHLQDTWLDAFRSVHPAADGATHILHGPFGLPLRRQRLDYIFLGGAANSWQVRQAAHVLPRGEPHSDHHAVLVRVG
jgi:endonuclease/exonuclease/phosphatase family metal-dependent hydrolase